MPLRFWTVLAGLPGILGSLEIHQKGAKNMKPLIGRLTPIIIAILVSITLPNQAHATRFDELRDTIQLPPSGGPITDSYYHFMVPSGYFVLNRAYSQQMRHSITINGAANINWNATITFTGSIGRIDVVDTARGKQTGDLVSYSREYAIYKVTDSGAIQQIVRKYISGGGRGPESTQSTSFDVGTLETGLYLLRIMARWEYLYLTLATSYYAYIPFEIIDSALSFNQPIYFVSPGDDLTMTATFDNDDPSSRLTASLIPDLAEPTQLPLQANRIGQRQYEIAYSVPASVAENTVYAVQIRALYGNFEVHRRYAFIVIGDGGFAPPDLNLEALCPFFMQPVWAIQGKQVMLGCSDNEYDNFVVLEGSVFLGNSGRIKLSNNNGQLITFVPAPQQEGVYTAIYELQVQDTQGRIYTVNGSQQVVVTATPEGLYCPPPGDGVSSSPASEGRVGLRLVR